MVRGFMKAIFASLALAGGWVQAEVTLNGSGASFPKPLYDKLVQQYQHIKPEIKINYSSVGSGTGIQQFSDGVTDFGGTDSPMKNAQIAKASGGALFHIPTALGAVVPIYNIQGIGNLQLSGPVLADIFSGKIENWNDPELTKINPGAKLPAAPITIVHRSDGSGTTAIFTDYLAKVSPEFNKNVGQGTSVKWSAPNAVAGKGNEGVAGSVLKTRNSIGYVELIYAKANDIKYAPVQNKAGRFVAATIESVSAAAGNLQGAPEDLRMSITNADGETAYPISGLTYVLVYQNQKDAAKGAAVVDFLWWVTHDGQATHASLNYAPLPAELIKKVEGKLTAIKGPDGKAFKSH
jgi:phosphate transport system substrate-binding protein